MGIRDRLPDPGRLVPESIRGSYLRKFATIVLLVVVVTGGVGYYFQDRVSAELTREVHANLETVAGLEADALEGWLEENRRTVRMLSEFRSIRTGNPLAIRMAFIEESESMPGEIHGLHYVSIAAERINTSTTRSLEGKRLSEMGITWQTGSLSFGHSERVAVSNVFEYEGKKLVAFLSPVEGRTEYGAMMTVRASERAEHFRRPTAGSYTQVVNADGTVVFDRNESDVGTAYAGAANVTELAMSQAGTTGIADGSEEEVVAYSPVSGTDWVVLVHAPRSEAFALRSAVTTDFVVLVGIALAGFLLIGLTLGRNTVRALDRLAERANAIAEGDLGSEIDASDRSDEIGQVTDAFGAMQAYLRTAAEQASAIADREFDDPVLEEDVPGEFGDALDRMRADLEALITDMEETNAELERKAESFGRTMEGAADGDLTVRMDADSSNEAMNEIARTFNRMMDDLEGTLVRIRSFADEVDDAVDSVTTSAREIERASEDVSESVQGIADGANRQEGQLQEVAGEMSDLSATIEEVASSADEVADVSQRAAERGQTGSEHASEAIDEMARIEATAEETTAEVAALAEEVERISEIVALIDDIAEQTNLLALNASIEAARAGEAGDGFAVVADEVKDLAGQAGEATDEIESLIEEVQDSTDRTVEDMEELSRRVTEGTDTIERALDSLDDIVSAIEDADRGVQEIDRATDEQAQSVQETVSMVEDVADVSTETADEAETVSAAAEEQTATVSEVTRSVEALADRSAELRDLLSEFEVETRDDSTGSFDFGDESLDADDAGGMQFGAAADGGRRGE